MGFWEMIERRRTRKILQRYLTPEIAEEILRKGAQKPQFEAKHFQFVLVLVDDANPKEIRAVISRVVDTMLDHGGCVSDITSSLVIGLLGEPFPEGNSPETRRKLVEALLRESGERIRIAHGECDGEVGQLGSQRRSAYGELIPRFSGILKALLETKLGAAVEVP